METYVSIRRNTIHKLCASLVPVFIWLLGFVLAWSLFVWTASRVFGSWGAFDAWSHGEILYVPNRTVLITDVSSDAKVSAQFSLRNLTRNPIQILGARTSCQCTVAKNLPLTIQAGETSRIDVTVTVPSDTSGVISNSVELYVDRPDRLLTLRIDIELGTL